MSINPYDGKPFDHLTLFEQNELIGFELLRESEAAYMMGSDNANK